MSQTILYLSPHLDDVVFSCSGHLIASREQGHRCIVATLFTEGDHELRKLEDLAALEICGAEHRWLGLRDAPWRDPYYSSLSRIVLGDAGDEVPDLRPLIEKISPDQVIAPLGVGTHIDHRLAFQAARKLSVPTLFYEDQPYAAIAGATRLRLQQLGYATRLSDFETYWESFLSARYVKTFASPGELPALKSALEKTWSGAPGMLQAISFEKTFPHRSAIQTYASQLPDFIDWIAFPKIETLWELSGK